MIRLKEGTENQDFIFLKILDSNHSKIRITETVLHIEYQGIVYKVVFINSSNEKHKRYAPALVRQMAGGRLVLEAFILYVEKRFTKKERQCSSK